MKKLLLLLFLSALTTVSCKKNAIVYPDTPQIYDQTTQPDHIKVSDPNAFVSIQFRFIDGDHNIADDPNETDSTIFIKDSRDTSSKPYTYTYPMPYIPPEMRPAGGLQGSITLHLSNAYFSPRDSTHLALGKDTMFWSIYVKDDNGNISNTIHSDTIYISYH